MRILVTGGAGYIGAVTVRMLLDAGHHVVVLDTLERGSRASIDRRAELAVGDIGDAGLHDELLPGTDAVMHLAGYIEVAESRRRPGMYFENNCAKPLLLLRSMVKHGISALVYSSSAAVYGEPEEVPITEDARCRPVNAYGASKLQFEEMLHWFEVAHGLRSARLRYFNAAGAWPDGSLGEAHDPETHLIPRVLDAAISDQGRFEVFGGDYPTPDGTCVRDYVHVMDLGDAHRRALERVAGGLEGGVFNLGNGRGYSNLEIVRMCEEITGEAIAVEYGPRREGDPAVLVASNERARETLGWTPERSALDEMVGDAWVFAQARPQSCE